MTFHPYTNLWDVMGPPKKNVALYFFWVSGGLLHPEFQWSCKAAIFWEWNFRLSMGPGAGPNPRNHLPNPFDIGPQRKEHCKKRHEKNSETRHGMELYMFSDTKPAQRM